MILMFGLGRSVFITAFHNAVLPLCVLFLSTVIGQPLVCRRPAGPGPCKGHVSMVRSRWGTCSVLEHPGWASRGSLGGAAMLPLSCSLLCFLLPVERGTTDASFAVDQGALYEWAKPHFLLSLGVLTAWKARRSFFAPGSQRKKMILEKWRIREESVPV